MAGPRPIAGWILWTDDGSVYSSHNTDPKDIPPDGILIILEVFENGTWQTLHGQDFYLWNGEEWQAGSERDLERWLRKLLPELKFGRWSTTQGWNAAMKAAAVWVETHDLDQALDESTEVLW